MALPVLLAGPIVRRVEPRLVAVWVATSQPRTVTLEVWPGQEPAGTTSDAAARGTRETLRIGAALHVAVVTADIEAPRAALIPGTRYSYNITLSTGDPDDDADLEKLGLLIDTAQQPALGYAPGVLPSFATCPLSIEKLQVMHGSCNRLHADGPNIFFVVDDLIKEKGGDANERPHQLLLTGDQVYSDDIAITLAAKVNDLARELIGARENVLLGKDELAVEVHQRNLPAGYRQDILTDIHEDDGVRRGAGLTSGSARCHALGVGERCALHLLHWAPEPWQAQLGGTSVIATLPAPAELLEHERHPLDERDLEGPPADMDSAQGAKFHAATTWLKDHLTRLDGQLEKLREEAETEREHVLRYFGRIGQVRRALANVPTYMIFDDHDVTDDWNLCAKWVRDVHDNALGRSVLRDGLVSFLLMQGWGNDPKAYEAGNGARLLAAAGRLFPEGAADGPAAAAVQEIETLLGIGSGQPPQVDWHFTIDGAVHRVIVCDTRTRRGFTGDIGPPIALPDGVREQQIPQGPLPAGMEMLFVVIPQPVLDSVLLGEFTQGAVSRFLAAKSHIRRVLLRTYNAMNSIRQPVPREVPLPPVDPPMYPLHKKDYEGWSTRPDEIEKLLARLATYRRVAILSGDIHHALTNSLRYWVRQPTTAGEMALVSEMAQLTCSAIQLSEYFAVVAAATGLQWIETLLGLGYPVQRLGWLDPAETPVTSPELPHSGLRRRLLQRPISVPTEGWPEGTAVTLTPDWAWSMDPVIDVRPDDQRPESVRIEALAADFPVAGGPIPPTTVPLTDPNGYAAVARRHAASMRSRNQTRQMLFFNNIARITFARDGDALVLRNELRSVNPKQQPAGPPDLYTVHEIRFGAPAQTPPPTIAHG